MELDAVCVRPVNSQTKLFAKSTRSCPPAAKFFVNPKSVALTSVFVSDDRGPPPTWVNVVDRRRKNWRSKSNRLSVSARACR
jgi:hypothetical protein